MTETIKTLKVSGVGEGLAGYDHGLQRTTVETDRVCADCGQRIGYVTDVGWVTFDGGICPAHMSGIHNHDDAPTAGTARKTYRERREARADRLRGWAEKREAKATAGFERSSEMAAQIPFGQPILVGHYSQGRDTRYRERIVNTGQRALEDARKAESMNSRADNIEAALAGAIYSDDPDAIEALEARIAGLEAERDRIKAFNASCRKGSPDESILTERELRGLESVRKHSAYSLGKHGEMPAYALANLSGNISKQRQRLAQLTRQATS